jgi:drug/metabolite transporter (DMT)-like permease
VRQLIQWYRCYRTDLVALLVVTIWGVSAPLRKAALAEFDVLPFTACRFLGMLVLGWGVFFWHYGVSREHRRVTRADIPSLILSGVCGYTLYLLLDLYGLNYTTAFSNSVLLATTPLFSALILWGLRLEPVGRRRWLGMCLALLGVVVFMWQKAHSGLQMARVGDLLSLAAALGFAGYTVMNRQLMERYSVAVVMTYTLTIGAIPALLLSLPAIPTQDWSRVTVLGWGALAWTVVVGVYLAWTLWNWVVTRMGAARAAVFMYLVPLISGVIAWLFLGEGLHRLELGGAILTLSGLALARRSVDSKSRQQPTAALVPARAVDTAIASKSLHQLAIGPLPPENVPGALHRSAHCAPRAAVPGARLYQGLQRA